ncbi:hypothetical protein [Paranoxybacillus vitaminiphilus]|uniref:hypothetical protein n=1 Tax=Paranoxybacillus vitaminiphilus TaxID=581036 RepID=UPI0015ECB13C|nr:hypothetical protein [Anoxybacillus vitaminiphilus]
MNMLKQSIKTSEGRVIVSEVIGANEAGKQLTICYCLSVFIILFEKWKFHKRVA